MAFETLLQLIKELDQVRAGTVNKPLRQIDQNVRYLWELLQAASIGSTVYAHRQTIEAEAVEGMAVWLNTTTLRFERGLAQAEAIPGTGVLITSNSTKVWGIVANKLNATLADILLFGVDDIDITNAIEGGLPVEAGDYYLSGTSPGTLTKQKPPVSVAVLRATPDGKVFVMPQFVDFLDRHTHYKFTLLCEPAGDTTPPGPGGTHTITNGDSDLRGWLPADHESFEGHAPPGAVFGYNLEADLGLKNAWPPQPLGQAYLEIDRGEDQAVGFTGVPLGKQGLCILDRYGIWWMSNCYGDVPWPTDFQTGISDSFSDSSTPECPRHLRMAMTLWFTRVNFATDTSMVLSLHSGDSRIKVRCFGTDDDATTGHLELFLDLNLTVEEDVNGYQALKEFDPETTQFKRGPIVEGLYPLSGNVKMVGSATKTRTIDEEEVTTYQGLVGVEVSPEETLELDVQLVRLNGAEEEHFQDLMYLSFRPEVQEEYRAKIEIPGDLSIPNPRMKLRFSILGRASGTLPQLVVTARRLSRPEDGLDTPVNLPLTAEEFTVTCNTQGVLTAANQYVEAESNPFDVAPGESIYFTVRRLADDGFTADVGILRQKGILISTEE